MNTPIPRISSSRAAAVIGVSKYTTRRELQAELLGNAPPREEAPPYDANHPWNRGKDLEPAIIQAAIRMMSGWIVGRGESDALPLTARVYTNNSGERDTEIEFIHSTEPMSAHPDFDLVDCWGRVWPMDAKSSALYGEYDPNDGEVPDDVYAQVHHLWECWRDYGRHSPRLHADAWDIQPFVGIPLCRLGRRFDPFCLVMVPIDLKRVESLVEAENEFLETYVYPALNGGDVPLPPAETLKDVLWGPFTEGKACPVDDEIRQLIDRMVAVKAAAMTWIDPVIGVNVTVSASEHRKYLDDLSLQIATRAGDAEYIADDDGAALCLVSRCRRDLPAQPVRVDEFVQVSFKTATFNKRLKLASKGPK